MYTYMNVTKEEMMQESELNGYIFPILTDQGVGFGEKD